jgi:hypothetical protein
VKQAKMKHEVVFQGKIVDTFSSFAKAYCYALGRWGSGSVGSAWNVRRVEPSGEKVVVTTVFG